ncbi:hypothetical protein M9194_18480 [Vibrio sp. S4M6]|uniref:hypothetical protein n=1 Tax=Vibrio sinus TaxID=2946865 RepID=UPI00202A5E41|nr:hypothetical protein [Vibrio sinus]MCL9783416.1 hypothetical protein [Vibrio sinus]
MIDVVTKYAALTAGICVIPFFITNAYLTIKLRPRKYELMQLIHQSAPKKFKSRALLLMEAHMSWVAGSACSYIWFVYPMLRYAWGIPAADISKWQTAIKNAIGSSYTLYWLSTMLLNLIFASLAVFIVNEYVIGKLV